MQPLGYIIRTFFLSHLVMCLCLLGVQCSQHLFVKSFVCLVSEMQMSRPSRRVICGLYSGNGINHHLLHRFSSSTPFLQHPFLRTCCCSSSSSLHPSSSIGFSNFTTAFIAPPQSNLFIPHSFSAKPTFSNGSISRFSTIHRSARCVPQTFSLATPKLGHNYAGFRFFAFKSSDLVGANRSFAKKVFDKPVTAVRSAFARYSEAIGLQIEAFFKRNYLFLLGAAGVMVCALLWKIMFGIANTFIGLSEGMAKYGFLALSSAIVAFAGLYIRSRFTINPDKIYRMAMTRLNTSAGILEVMGAPLSGTDLRAYVMSGGGLTLKKFKPSIRNRRCFLIFPIRGSERKGLVSVEVKKKKGQYDMKLLAIDVPMASGPDQRLFLIGDEEEYRVGGGLISELRDPVVKAMAATKEFEDLDKIEEEEDAERERLEAERKHREEIEKLEKTGS